MGKCCVEGCEDKYSPDITYFNFPASKALRRAWCSALGIARARPGAAVCSEHFASDDCQRARARTRLRPTAVPSLLQTKRTRTDSSSSDSTPIIELKNKTSPDDADTLTDSKDHQNDGEDPANEESVDVKLKDGNVKTTNHIKRKNLHDKLKDLREKSLRHKKGSTKNTENLQDDIDNSKTGNDNSINETDSLLNKKDNLNNEKENLNNEADNLNIKRDLDDDSTNETDILQNDTDSAKDIVDNSPEKDLKDKDDVSKRKEGDKKDPVGEKGGQSVKSLEKCKESIPPPADPKDADKAEDIEELLTNYTILQDRPANIHTVSQEPPPHTPVFIEISVDKDNSGCSDSDRNDCLMVVESVQVELDPAALMLEPARDRRRAGTVDVDDAPAEKEDPISLLTSSDEDDVIIEEPHIDTVEVSDETDEDDMPLVKLLKRRRADKKKEISGEPDFAKLLWGMYEYYCVQCHYTTSSGIEYRKHTASHAKVLMMCQICGYMTASETQFTKHEKQHGEKKYKCHLCSYKAKHNMSLLYHLKGHKAEDFLKNAPAQVLKAKGKGRVFECKFCSYVTKKRCDLRRHEFRRHKKDNDEDFVP